MALVMVTSTVPATPDGEVAVHRVTVEQLAVVAGLAGWVLASFACLVSIWMSVRLEQRVHDGGGTHRPPVVATAPLVTGIVVALAVSLGVAG